MPSPFEEGSMPWQVKALGFIGIPGVIALWLVYTLTGTIASDVRIMKENLILHQDDSIKLNQNIEYYMRVQNQLTQQLCINAAESADERAGCFKP